LNLRPSGYEPDELPDCSTPRRGLHDSSGPAALQTGPPPAGGRSVASTPMWTRRRRNDVDPTTLDARFAAIERRLDDLEDLANVALAPDRVDALAAQVEDLAASSATHDEVVELRMQTIRIAAEVAEATGELRSVLAAGRASAD
jgi:hypothetical protein